MKNPLTLSLITLTAITIGAVLWYAQNMQKNTAQNIAHNTTQNTTQTTAEGDLTTKSSETPNTTKQLPKEEIEPQNSRDTNNVATDSANTDNTNTNNAAIRYNADGSIDMGNWKHHNIGAISVKYPQNWYYYDYNTITNKKTNIDQHGNPILTKDLRKGEVRISIAGAPLDIAGEDNSENIAERTFRTFIEKRDFPCRILINTKDKKLAKCWNKNDSYEEYFKISNGGESLVFITASSDDVMSNANDVIDQIIDSFYLFSEKFIPPSIQ